MGQLLDRHEAAKAAGVSVFAVDKAAKEGKLRKAARGKFDLDDVKAWRAGALDAAAMLNTVTQKATRAARAEASAPAAELVAADDDEDEVDPPAPRAQLAEAGSVMLRAKTQTEVYKARERELSFKKLAGSLVERDKVKKEAADATRVLVSRLRAFPMRLGPMLAPITSESECIKAVEAEVRDLILELQEAVAAI